MHIPKWLIATAGVFVAMLIAALGFLVGRESAPSRAAEMPATAGTQAVSAVRDPAPEPPAPPVPGASSAGAAVVTPAVIDPASSITPIPSSSPGAADARTRVAAYFAQMEAIQSGGMVGNEEEFATTIVNAAVSGNFSGIDDLVRAAGDAERRALALQPPGECLEYHQQVIALLQESTTMVTTLRDGLKRNDADALTAIGASAQSMKLRAENLAAAGKAIRARFGL